MPTTTDQPTDPATALRTQIHRIRAGPSSAPPPLNLAPASAYEALTRQMVEDLADDLAEIKGRLNGLLWMVASALLLDLIVRLTGTG